MTAGLGRPRIEIPQLWVPGTDGAEVRLTIHAITERNFTQRITIARRALRQTGFRYHDIVLTRDQLHDVIGELDERTGIMTGEIPRSPRD